MKRFMWSCDVAWWRWLVGVSVPRVGRDYVWLRVYVGPVLIEIDWTRGEA